MFKQFGFLEMALFASKDDIRELTGRERYEAQKKVLTAMGVPFRVRFDNSPAVLVEDIKSGQGKVSRESEPDWGALGE
jgi:hypothetical protein